jgi:xylulokinase
MTLLGLDCGSSSIKAAILRDGRVVGQIVRASYQTRFDGVRAELDAAAVLKGLRDVVRQLGPAALRKIEAIVLDTMAASWIAMDRRGAALTPIITHQDRRSVDVAMRIEREVGKARHLKLSGNRPVPGGISSTTWAWFNQHEPRLMRRVDLVGHLSTFLVRTLTGARVVDPSHASFMGVYSTHSMSGWNDELCTAIGAPRRLLPDILDADRIAGRITPDAARKFALRAGTPITAGIVDTSGALLLHGVRVGQLLNVCGSTDVLALCTDHPKPHERLLTRAVGIGEKRWVQVGTIAAAGSALAWAHRQLFADLSENAFRRLMRQLAHDPIKSSVRFDPYLAGDRTSVEQRTAAFSGLTLSTTRQQMLGAIIESLASASAARIPLLRATGTPMRRDVILSGGLQGGLADVLHRDWPGRWRFQQEDEATLRGLARLTPRD